MTADVKLLPLPEPNGSYTNPYDADDMTSYARVNTEALRELAESRHDEMERLRDGWHMAKKHHDAAEARAERLAEALRMYMAAGFGNSTDFYKQAEAQRAAQAALHPTAAQEDGRE